MAIEWTTQGAAPLPYQDTDFLMGGRGISPYKFLLSQFMKKDVNGRFGNVAGAETALHINGGLTLGDVGGTLGIVFSESLAAIPGASVKCHIASGNSTAGFSAGALIMQPRTGVAAPIVFATEGSAKAQISSTGNLGLGVVPGYRFHMVDVGAVGMFQSSTDYGGNIGLKNTLREWRSGMLGSVGTSKYSIFDVTGGIERIGVDPAADVGTIIRSGTTGTRTLHLSTGSTASYTPSLYNGGKAQILIQSGNANGAFTGIQLSHGGQFEVLVGAVQSGAVADFVVQGYSGSSYGERLRVTAAGPILPGADNSQSLGSGALRMSTIFAGTGTINTSDAREKQDIVPIDDALLDAWTDVQFIAHRWTASVAEKGDDARWHFGLIAQQVRDTLAAHDLDGTRYGLLCFDQWEREERPIFARRSITKTRFEERESDTLFDADGNPAMLRIEVEYQEDEEYDTGEVELVREAGDRWGLRYTQVLIVEAVWQRREREQLRQQLEVLVERVRVLEDA